MSGHRVAAPSKVDTDGASAHATLASGLAGDALPQVFDYDARAEVLGSGRERNGINRNRSGSRRTKVHPPEGRRRVLAPRPQLGWHLPLRRWPRRHVELKYVSAESRSGINLPHLPPMVTFG